MKRILILTIAILVTTTNLWAQRIGCVQGSTETRAHAIQKLPASNDFDPQKIYRQPVVLITFNDTEFSMSDPAAYYNRLFNEEGFNEGKGKGCVADYFREQSGGRLNLQFDIYGPVKVNAKAGGRKDEYAISGKDLYGTKNMREAIQALDVPEGTDFTIYDWNGDGEVDQVIFVAAGFTGNTVPGYIWPNSGSARIKMPGGMIINYYSFSCEMWGDKSLCGIGTIIHEFCHDLGLPDIYPQSPVKDFSAVDEWDLMDGGNYTNYGWCPPNLSAMEKMFLGWATPIELTEPTVIKNMKPVSDGGETYIIRNSGNPDEFYLLEYRRQEGWDYGCPGNGLLIYHVDYDKNAWVQNIVNAETGHYRYDLFHADGKAYTDWDANNNGKDMTKWTMENRLRSKYLSTSPYPFYNPETETTNASLTDESNPAASLYTANAEGKMFMGKPITNIQMDDEGNMSFCFMKMNDTGVSDITGDGADIVGWYDLNGRRLHRQPLIPGIYIVRYSNGTQKKYFRQE